MERIMVDEGVMAHFFYHFSSNALFIDFALVGISKKDNDIAFVI